MANLVELMAEGIARHTESRRSFIGKISRMGLAVTAAVASNATIGVLTAHAGLCGPPCGQFCNSFDANYCDVYDGCATNYGCYLNYNYYASGCWVSGTSYCCDCWCPVAGNPGCVSGSVFQCGCEFRGTAPAKR